MEEWDKYLTTSGANFFPSSPHALSSASAADRGASLLDDVFGASSPAAVASPVSANDDPFSSSSPTTMSTQSASPPAAKTTATSSIDNFMGKSSGKKKGQTLAQMQQANDGFLTGEKKKPVASSPSIFMQGIMNYYDVLGVAVMSSDEEIKAKYKQKSLDLHPDRHQNQAEDDVAMYKLVTKAYETLSDPVAKMQYDMEQRMNNQGAAQPTQQNWLNHLGGGGGRPAGNAQQPMGGFGFGSSPPPMQQQQQQQQQRSNDPFGFF